jgi:hypothetical protein
MEGTFRNVRSYKKNPVITVPQTPDYIKQLLPSAPSSSLPPSPNDTRGPQSTTLGSPFNERGWMDGSSSQPRLRQSPQTDGQKLALKFEKMEVLLKDSGFDSVGEFLEILFYNPSCITGEPDLRGSFHVKAVSRFLQGRNETETVGDPGSSVAVSPTIDIEEGKRPRRKVPIVPKARRKARPHSLIKWTSSTDANKMFARKIEYSVISLHSLSCRCSGSTQMTCHLMHSLISPAKRIPAFRAALRVSLQYENAKTLSFESSKT